MQLGRKSDHFISKHHLWRDPLLLDRVIIPLLHRKLKDAPLHPAAKQRDFDVLISQAKYTWVAPADEFDALISAWALTAFSEDEFIALVALAIEATSEGNS